VIARAAALVFAAMLAREAHAADKQLGFADFWTVAGATHADTPATLTAKWGKPEEEKRDADGGVMLRWSHGPSANFSATGLMAGGLMIDLHSGMDDWVATHPGPATSLLGLTCQAAAARLKFAKKVGGYTTCKHYEPNGWLLDVTIMCVLGHVSTVVVNWVPIPRSDRLPADHCN
jgi:hypothetical protein